MMRHWNRRRSRIVRICSVLTCTFLLMEGAVFSHLFSVDMGTIYAAVQAEPTYTVTPVDTYYLRSLEELVVYESPTEEAAQIATVPADTIFIVSGETADGWCQVYYLGKQRYIRNAGVEQYAGGAMETPQPVITCNRLDEDGNEKALTMNFLGDSVTYGDKLAYRSQSYASILGAKTGAAVNNYGLNGSCMAGFHPDRFIDRYLEMSDDADVVFVFGGTNDYEFNTGLAAMGNIYDTTFYGMLNQLMCGLKQKYPEAQIIFLTPLRRNYDTRQNEKGRILEQYANAIVNMGAFYDIPVVDLYHTQELNFKGTGYLVDGLHPTAVGQRRIANYLYGLLFE